jgi:hypothetical protein
MCAGGGVAVGYRITTVCLALVSCALVGALACSKNTATQPQPPMSTLWGRVTEGGFGLPQATVEVTASWGRNSATTDSNGNYTGLKAWGDVTLRAQKEGFSTQVKQLTVEQNQVVNFELQRVETPGDPQGVYTLVITSSPSCTALPPEVMQRNYVARIVRTQDDLVVSVLRADSVEVGKFTGTRDGSTVWFKVEGLGESLPADKLLSYDGTATGTVGDRTIVAAFDGTVRVFGYWDFYLNEDPLPLAQCQAKDHRLEFVR